MKRYLLDTNAAADCIFRRHKVDEHAKERRKAGHVIGVGLPVLAELFAGIEYSASRDKNLKIVERNLGCFRIWPFDLPAAREFGKLYAELRRAGRPMQTSDLMIAAIARSLGQCTIVSTDSDFNGISGISTENWRTDES